MASGPRDSKQRDAVVDAVADRLGPGEDVIAVLAFASTPKRPKGPEGKVRQGIYTSSRRYRPIVATTRRLFVLGGGRTPYPRGVVAEFPLADVGYVDEVPARFSATRLLLELPDNGTVPFDLGRYDVRELPPLRTALEGR
jgi:hypothetical protein